LHYPENLFWGVDLRYDHAVRDTDLRTAEADQPKNQFFWNAKAGIASPHGYQSHLAIENGVNRDKKTNKDFPTLSTISFNFFQEVSTAVKFATSFALEQRNVVGPRAHVGGEYKVDKDTAVKGKFGVGWADKEANREFRLGLGVKQQVSEHASITVGADINARALLGGHHVDLGNTKPHTFGFELKLS